MLNLMARVPLVLWILLIGMMITPPSVSALPDTADPNLGHHLNPLAGLAALAAAAAAVAAALAADNPSETQETPSASAFAPRCKPKPIRRKKGRLSARKKTKYDYAGAKDTIGLESDAMCHEVVAATMTRRDPPIPPTPDNNKVNAENKKMGRAIAISALRSSELKWQGLYSSSYSRRSLYHYQGLVG